MYVKITFVSNPTFRWNREWQIIVTMKTKFRRLAIQDTKNYYKARVIKTVWY